MKQNLIVIDDFLDDPDLTRQEALEFDYSKVSHYFPGARSTKKCGSDVFEITKKLEKILDGKIKWGLESDTFHFQSCFEGTKTWIHVDDWEWAAVLYLTPDAIVDSGTGIYHVNKENRYELNISVGNIYNRMILYRGGTLHHCSLLPGFGTTLETSRLTQVFFFDVEPNGQEQVSL